MLMNPPILTRDELRSWLDQRREFVLIDTAFPEDYAAQHLPSAQNACVFEVNFLDQVSALDGPQASVAARSTGGRPRRDVPVVVYGASTRSLASMTAAEKLQLPCS